MKKYVLGYGSLINRASRLMTVPTAHEAFPVKLEGFTRGWWARTPVPGFTTTFLGCISVADFRRFRGERPHDDYLNGVFFEVSDEDLLAMDKRERGYDRVLVAKSQLGFYEASSGFDPDGEFYIYLNNFSDEAQFESALPSENVPIVQSYVDICMEGCLEQEAEFSFLLEEDFVSRFLLSCQEWNVHWVNDRIHPRRPHVYSPQAFKIDQILYDSPLKRIYETVRIE
ncbi:gamma-glutamylcyclotransferase family protein [Ravibacter arvi]